MKNLIKKFQNISHQYNLWQKGSRIVLGVSGGPDSVCMLDIFAKLQKKYDLKLIIAHVNYGLRGKDSNKDADFVRKLTARYSLKFVEIKPKFKKSGNLENQLREIRYKFFEKIRAKNKFNYIAIGHTLDDQAETYLMRIIRGSGLVGMASMKFKAVHPVKYPQGGVGKAEFNRASIIRPLLGITKKEVLEYLDRTDGTYRTDKTNKEIPFLRNKIRNELIPLLEKKYNPNIKETLYNSSLNIAEDYDLISKIAKDFYRKNKKLEASAILKLHPALQKRIILKAIENIKPDLKDIESAHINEVLKIIKSAKSKRQIVKFQGLKIVRIGDKITIQKL